MFQKSTVCWERTCSSDMNGSRIHFLLFISLIWAKMKTFLKSMKEMIEKKAVQEKQVAD